MVAMLAPSAQEGCRAIAPGQTLDHGNAEVLLYEVRLCCTKMQSLNAHFVLCA